MGARSFCEYERPNRTRTSTRENRPRMGDSHVCRNSRWISDMLLRFGAARANGERTNVGRALGGVARASRAAGDSRARRRVRTPARVHDSVAEPAARALATFVSPPRLVRPGRSRDPRRPAALAREMASLRESRGALRLGDAPDAPALGFEATAPIQLPDASRPLPPASASDGDAVSVPADVPSKLRGWALALALGRALPPAPPTPDGTTAPVAWHPHTPRLATVDRTGRVLIHADPAAPRAPRAPPSALRHSLHAGARALAWRPNAGATLAVGGANGVCVWSHEAGARDGVGGVGGAPSRAGARIGGAPRWRLRRLCEDDDEVFGDADPFRAASRADGVAARLVAILRGLAPNLPAPLARLFSILSDVSSDVSSDDSRPRRRRPSAPCDAMAFSPCGRLLVAGARDRAAMRCWDLSTDRRVNIASGVSGTSFLAWSPCGEYLFAAHPDGGFTLWETDAWTSESWSTDGALATAAAWGPRNADGAVVLVTTRGGEGQVLAVHLPDGAPSLAARILPVELPRLARDGADGGSDGERDANAADIAGMSWDPSGKRLAVVFDSAGANGARERGRVALYSVRTSPVVSASLVGYVSAPEKDAAAGGAGGHARAATLSGPGGGIGGGADDVKGAEATTTLAVCWEGGGVSVVPVFA